MTLLELPRSSRAAPSLAAAEPLAGSLFELPSRGTSRHAPSDLRTIPRGWVYLAASLLSAGLWWGLITLVLAAFN